MANPLLLVFFLQRISGLLLAVLLAIHLITIMFAVQGELTVAEIVARVRNNLVWTVFYGIFIFTAVLHATIGLRNIISEMSNLSEKVTGLIVSLYALGSLLLGYFALRAIW